jgi:ATP-dependent DNA helicase RecQ
MTTRLNAMRKTLRDVFGITRLRPGQHKIVCSVLEGRDTLAVMPTGSGKSLCYQLPALHLEGWTLVVSPLIALMKDQYDKLRKTGLDPLRISSTVPAAELRETYDRLRTARRGIVFVTPEQLIKPELIDALGAPSDIASSSWSSTRRTASRNGARFPSSVSAYRRRGEGARQTAGPRADRHSHTGYPRGHRPLARAGRAAHRQHGRLSRQSSLSRRADVGRGRTSARIDPRAGSEAAALRKLLATETGRGIIYTATVREAEQLSAMMSQWRWNAPRLSASCRETPA